MKRALFLFGLFLAAAPRPARAQEEAPPPQGPEAKPREKRRGFTMKADLGFAYRRLYSIPILAAEIDAMFGGSTKHVDIYGGVNLLIGTTEFGLTTTRLDFGATVLFPVSERVRLGVEPLMGVISIRRATKNDSITAIGAGGYGMVTVDFAEIDPWALYAGLRVGAENYIGSTPSAWLWGGTISLGARY